MTQAELQQVLQGRSAALKMLRIKSKICRRSLSAKSGLSCGTIYKMEKGTVEWSIASEILYLSGLNKR